MEEVIKVEQLSKSYDGLLAVDNLNISVKPGMVFGLLGANGAGKSTAIECMLGTKRCDSKKISILGMNPQRERKKLFEKVGVQFQEASILYFPMLIFSGATLPYEVMPVKLQKIADVLPLTQGIKLLKAASLGLSADNVRMPIIVMAVLGIVCIGISIRFFKWE
ncbi:ATP-binding cassette domain-containing protein [Anaerocolumna sp.]|uniref:ATP-binding cassette domain-containing protein n=1 Tax=Anaerocolumna sp. TaxID=2041569 RepID=UPI0028B0B4A2|nr:ATP-binding cassette domain-containing protein [Anaerocolumna sp.]